jgi:hypothetical protein
MTYANNQSSLGIEITKRDFIHLNQHNGFNFSAFKSVT